jgi:phage terminase small subunit
MFCHFYVLELNACLAARRAGYKSVDMGHRLLRQLEVARYIAELMERDYKLTRVKIVQEIAGIAFSSVGDFIDADGRVDLKNCTPDQLKMISEVSATIDEHGNIRTRIKLHDKVAALDKLMRAVGGYLDKVQLSGPGGEPLQITIVKGLADEPIALRSALDQ